jgi:hypothetical protein
MRLQQLCNLLPQLVHLLFQKVQLLQFHLQQPTVDREQIDAGRQRIAQLLGGGA